VLRRLWIRLLGPGSSVRSQDVSNAEEEAEASCEDAEARVQPCGVEVIPVGVEKSTFLRRMFLRRSERRSIAYILLAVRVSSSKEFGMKLRISFGVVLILLAYSYQDGHAQESSGPGCPLAGLSYSSLPTEQHHQT